MSDEEAKGGGILGLPLWAWVVGIGVILAIIGLRAAKDRKDALDVYLD